MTEPPAQTQALIGHTGFVGTTLKKQHKFSHFYRSTDIQEARNGDFGLVVCAGAPAKKWLANQKPEEDWTSIQQLITALSSITAKQFVLISTVDVFLQPVAVDESSLVQTDNLHPYGLHRRKLEEFVMDHFPAHVIIRLPGLVGPGLRKNILYDIHHGNDLHKIDHRSVFQFYPMLNLWSDICLAIQSSQRMLHLTAEPLSVAEVSEEGFGIPFENELPSVPPRYDFQSQHAALFGGEGRYQYSKRESLLAIRAYAQTEPALP